MAKTKINAIIFSFAIAILRTTFSTRTDEGGWDSEPYDYYGVGLASQQNDETGDRNLLSDLVIPSSRVMKTDCDMHRMLYCLNRVMETETPENATFKNCRSALSEVLEPETFQPNKLTSVCRAYMEVNLCAEQTHCEINTVLKYIENNKKNFPPDLKHCYDVSRKACTDIAVGPTPFNVCIGCHHCCNRPGCFGNDATVLTEDGRRLKMTQLSVGDRVLAADPETGMFFYEEVLTFLHQDVNNNLKDFVYLSLANDAEVSLSPYHLIYVATDEELKTSIRGNQTTLGQPRYAIDVKPGDFVFTAYSPGNKNQIIEVLAVNLKAELSGYFAPLTTSGHIVVNDVLMSCYAHSSSHKLVHWFMTPLIAYYKISSKLSPWLPLSLGWLSTHTEDGIHKYADVLRNTVGAIPFMQSFGPQLPL